MPLCLASGAPSTHTDMVVDQNGGGDFQSVSAAIDALPMFPYQRVVILIRNGVYNEKIRINQDFVTLRGESRDSTIIRYSQLRSDWDEHPDAIGPAVVNIYGDDIILDNLTVDNSQPEIGPHAFAIYGKGTRTILINCNFISKGGDTVSLWNHKAGLYYHAKCYFQGAVDFVCPRGWCFVRDSKFYEVKQTAAIWHDGHYDPSQKFVILHSSFDGVEGFQLGRHHYDAQFYLLNCRFASTIADQPIYLVTYEDSSKNNPYLYGERKFFYDCTTEGKPYEWYQNNLRNSPGSPTPETITASWTFDGKWDPEGTDPVKIIDYSFHGKSLILTFNEIVSVRGMPVFQNEKGKQFRIVKRRFTDINRLEFISVEDISLQDLTGEFTMLDGDIIASVATVRERSLDKPFQIASKQIEIQE